MKVLIATEKPFAADFKYLTDIMPQNDIVITKQGHKVFNQYLNGLN